MQEYRVIGPPGCGKTTWLSRQVVRACKKGEDILIASLTRAAAVEVAGRDLPIPQDAIGTLHAHCYRALGRPDIAETKAKYLDDWNAAYPQWEMSSSSQDIDEDNTADNVGSKPGDQAMQELGILRARLTDVYPTSIRLFAKAWKEWKETNHLVDFTGLIEICLDSVGIAPGHPSVMFLDEAQDMDALEMQLARKWGERAGYLVTVGDPDQNLYQWRGSDPEAFLTPALPEDQKMVLAQSYRIPWAVHGLAVEWINKTYGREPIDYLPRNCDGEVRTTNGSYRKVEPLYEDIERSVLAGKSVMVLATCSYMLGPVIARLRAEGLPFHNQYRRKRGDWNPLAARKGISAADRLLAFLHLSQESQWNVDDIEKWSSAVIAKSVLDSGDRGDLQLFYDEDEQGVPWDILNYMLTDEALAAGLAGDVGWYKDNLLASKARGAAFPCTVVQQRGLDCLLTAPLVTVGTIHSVKGGEADVVYLMPDLSIAGAHQWQGGANGTAAIRRLFYVGMTRARETLVLCSPGGNTAVTL